MYYYIDMDRKKLLTKQETLVLEAIVAGKTNPEIGNELCISIHTVKIHIENIYRKLNVHNKIQAAVYAVVNNLVEY